MKEVTARLDIEIFAHCPHCDYIIDIMNENETNGRNHNEDGHVLSQAVPDANWIEVHKTFEVLNITCTKCKKDFNVHGLEW